MIVSEQKEMMRQAITSHSIFKALSSKIIEDVIENATLRKIKVGEVLITQNDPADCMYIVLKGRLAVWIDKYNVTEIGAGDIVGELALLTDEPRNATVIGVAETELMEISKNSFTSALENNLIITKAIYASSIKRLSNNFSGWFANKESRQDIPSKWRQTMMVLVAIYPIIVLEVKYLNPLLLWLPNPVALFISLTVSMVLTSWLLMPIVIYLFGWWLFPKSEKPSRLLKDLVFIVAVYIIEIVTIGWYVWN